MEQTEQTEQTETRLMTPFPSFSLFPFVPLSLLIDSQSKVEKSVKPQRESLRGHKPQPFVLRRRTSGKC